ncbi:MAG: hypothetical protein EA425_08685 [Puniceicoccaceae bacterium]|nr:MAG: hypothetical protein EA425_08685 [Puniceicoccaceae bacterium]
MKTTSNPLTAAPTRFRTLLTWAVLLLLLVAITTWLLAMAEGTMAAGFLVLGTAMALLGALLIQEARGQRPSYIHRGRANVRARRNPIEETTDLLPDLPTGLVLPYAVQRRLAMRGLVVRARRPGRAKRSLETTLSA